MGGGSNTTSVTIPAWLEDAAKKGIARAEDVSRIGYTPYYGPDVAAMAPAQIAAMQGTNQMASAFGMPASDPTAGMPTATNYNGMSAYSSGGMYDAALAELKARSPGLYAAITGMFIDPVTGELRSSSYSRGGGGGTASAAATSSGGMAYGGEGMDRYSYAKDYGGNNGYPGTTSWDTVGSYLPGGMNTSNPGSLKNTIAAALTSGKQAAPTAANRPISRSSASAYGGQSGGGSSGGSSSGGSSSGRNESRR